jgi:hypothetical protein
MQDLFHDLGITAAESIDNILPIGISQVASKPV